MTMTRMVRALLSSFLVVGVAGPWLPARAAVGLCMRRP